MNADQMIDWNEAKPSAAPVTEMTETGLVSYWLAMVKFGRIEIALGANGKPLQFAEHSAAEQKAADFIAERLAAGKGRVS